MAYTLTLERNYENGVHREVEPVASVASTSQCLEYLLKLLYQSEINRNLIEVTVG